MKTRPKRDPSRPQASLTESNFQARVIVCARANGWRVDNEDAHPSGGSPLHRYLVYTLGKIPLQKLQRFLEGRRGGVFSLVYHTHDSRFSQAGFPDLVMVHPRRQLVLFAELKRCGGYPSLEQRIWLASLARALSGTPNVSVRLWDPDDWPAVVETLGGVDTGLF